MKKKISLVMLFLVPIAAFSQNWDLRQCVDYAIENNIQIKQAITTVDINRLNKTQAKFDYLPSLNASTGYGISFGRALNETSYEFVNKTTNNVNSSISLNADLFAGMKKMHSLKRSELSLLASIEDVALLKNDISIAVSGAYLQILYNKEQIQNSQNQIEVITEQLDRTKKMVAAGSIALGSQLEMEAQLASERYNLVTHENNHRTSLLTITQLLELRNYADFDIVTPDVSKIINMPIGFDVNQINDAAQTLPQIEAAAIRLQIAETDVQIARAQYYPSLSLSASYGSSFSDASKIRTLVVDQNGNPVLNPDGSMQYDVRNYPFWDQYSDFASSGIQVSLRVPIFNGLTVRRNVNKAKIGVTNSDYSLILAKNQLFKDIQQAHNNATAALNSYNAAEANVANTKESFRYAQQKFNSGAANSIDYITAQNNMITAQSTLLQAKYEYVFRIKILDFYRGIPLVL